MSINSDNNFARVFEFPQKMPTEFCFGGGHAVEFKLVDWFNPIPLHEIGDDEITSWVDYEAMIKDFVSKKRYVKAGFKYLIVTDFNESFVFIGGL